MVEVGFERQTPKSGSVTLFCTIAPGNHLVTLTDMNIHSYSNKIFNGIIPGPDVSLHPAGRPCREDKPLG